MSRYKENKLSTKKFSHKYRHFRLCFTQKYLTTLPKKLSQFWIKCSYRINTEKENLCYLLQLMQNSNAFENTNKKSIAQNTFISL